MTDGRRRAEIAGAGIAGLAAAAALAGRGWQVRVHERDAELRELGAGISLRENGIKALEALGAFEEATRAGEQILSWELRDERLRTLSRGTMNEATRFWTVPRRHLHQALSNAAERAGAEIVTGSSVAGATPAGELLLAGGGAAQRRSRHRSRRHRIGGPPVDRHRGGRDRPAVHVPARAHPARRG